MKNIYYILIVLVLANCRNKQKNVESKKSEVINTVPNGKISLHKYGIIKKSDPLKINGIECYWEQTDTLVDEGSMELIKLKDYKTNRILVKHIDCCLKYGFDFQTKENFNDVNFDGFKDFLIKTYGSMAMFELTNIYLFDHKTKKYVYSSLSDNSITTDSINRKLTTSNFDKNQNGNIEKTKIHYFDKNGKLKYSEINSIENIDTTNISYKTYEKIVSGKVVETKKVKVVKNEN